MEGPARVRVLDFGVEGSTPFLVLDYAPNGSLRTQFPAKTTVPLETIVPLVHQVAEAAEPHKLAAFLFETASAFTTFYEHCPVLQAGEESVRRSRLALSALTLRVLLAGLDLLGVPVPERM